jgi:hypothetical protein
MLRPTRAVNTSFYTKNITSLKPEMYLNFIQRSFYKIVHLIGTFNRRNYDRVANICFFKLRTRVKRKSYFVLLHTHTHTHTHTYKQYLPHFQTVYTLREKTLCFIQVSTPISLQHCIQNTVFFQLLQVQYRL